VVITQKTTYVTIKQIPLKIACVFHFNFQPFLYLFHCIQRRTRVKAQTVMISHYQVLLALKRPLLIWFGRGFEPRRDAYGLVASLHRFNCARLCVSCCFYRPAPRWCSWLNTLHGRGTFPDYKTANYCSCNYRNYTAEAAALVAVCISHISSAPFWWPS